MSDPSGGAQSKLVHNVTGARSYTLSALHERAVDQFRAEVNEEMLREATTVAKRRALVRDVVTYIIAIESLVVDANDKAAIIASVYSDLFGYGALDPLLLDARVTTITLNGLDTVAVRYGHGDLVSLPRLFPDLQTMREVVGRLLVDAGLDFDADRPVREFGLRVNGRRAAVSIADGAWLSVDVRLHPHEPPTLEDLIAAGVLSGEAAQLLQRISESVYGLIIAGEVETGKTTLLNALLLALTDLDGVVAVTHAGELVVPTNGEQITLASEQGFADGINTALARQLRLLLLDEVRPNDSAALLPLLSQEVGFRQWWIVRGATDPARLQTALSLMARRADPSAGDRLVEQLRARLPFLITLVRQQGQLRVNAIAEWVATREGNAGYADHFRRLGDSLIRVEPPINSRL